MSMGFLLPMLLKGLFKGAMSSGIVRHAVERKK